MGKIVCPKCEKDDQIQKVTSIFTGGISTSNYEVRGAMYNSGSSVSQTTLSKRLSPPPKPKSSSDALKDWMSFSGCVLFVIFAFVIGVVLAVIIPSLLQDPQFLLLIMLSMAGAFGAELWIFTASTKNSAKSVSDWEKMIAQNYNELYYCHRDDCVFDPRNQKYASPEGISKLL